MHFVKQDLDYNQCLKGKVKKGKIFCFAFILCVCVCVFRNKFYLGLYVRLKMKQNNQKIITYSLEWLILRKA